MGAFQICVGRHVLDSRFKIALHQEGVNGKILQDSGCITLRLFKTATLQGLGFRVSKEA